VRFGEPTTSKGGKREDIAESAFEICHQINRRTVVTPASIAAIALLTNAKRGVTLEEFNSSAELIFGYMKGRGSELSGRFSKSTVQALDFALSRFANSGLISARRDAAEPFIAVDDEKRIPLAMFKNSSVHYMITISVICTIIKRNIRDGIEKKQLVEDLEIAKRLLKHEFRFATSRGIEEHVDDALDYLTKSGAIEMKGEKIMPIQDKLWQIDLFASGVTPFFEALAVTLTFVSERMRSSMGKKALIAEIRRTGEDMLLLGRTQYRESLMKDLISNSLSALRAYGVTEVEKAKIPAKTQKTYLRPKELRSLSTLKAELERFTQTP